MELKFLLLFFFLTIFNVPKLLGTGFIVAEERPEYFFKDLENSLKNLPEDSPILLSHELDLEVAEANEIIAKSEQGFQVGVNVHGQSVHEDRPSESFYHHYRAVNQAYLRKPIYHWGGLKAQEKIANLNKRWAKDKLFFRKRTLASEVRAVFLELVVQKFRIELAREQEKVARQNVNTIEEKVKVGVLPAFSLEEAKTEQLSREIYLSELELMLQRLKNKFINVSGYSNSLNLQIPNDFWEYVLRKDIKKDFPILVGSLNSPELKNLNMQASIELERIKIADSQLKPKLNFTSVYFQDQIDVVQSGRNLDRNNLILGLEMNWAIWDSHKSKSQKKAALARKAKVDHLIKTKARELREHANSLVQELRSLEERIILSRKLIGVVQGRLEKSKLELDLDRISPLDHFSVIVSLDEAKLGNLEVFSRYMVLLDQYEQIISSDDKLLVRTD